MSVNIITIILRIERCQTVNAITNFEDYTRDIIENDVDLIDF